VVAKMVPPREVVWIGSSLGDLKSFPDIVKQTMGFALFQAQCGGKHLQAKALKGFKGGGVLEVIEDYDGDTYRMMYTVRFSDAVYVLHSFQKKAKRGIKTPKHEMDIVEARLKIAAELHESRQRQEGG
jgi:phage-related protein